MSTLGFSAAVLLLAATAAHPNSLSVTEVRVEGFEARVGMQLQVLSLLEVVEGLDSDTDGTVSRSEVEAKGSEVFLYVFDHYLLRTGAGETGTGGTPLAPEPRDLRHVAPGAAGLLGSRAGVVEIEVLYRSPVPIRDLTIECTLFWTTSPDHVDLATVRWSERESQSMMLSQAEPLGHSVLDGRSAFEAFFDHGWRSALGRWDHLAFLALLLLSARRARALCAVLVAFAAGSSSGLWTAGLELAGIALPDHLVQSAAALSVAYLAADSLLDAKGERTRWPEALVLGAVHGLALAGTVRAALLREPAVEPALAGYHAGAVVGLGLGAYALGLLFRLARLRSQETHASPHLRRARTAASVLLLALGFWGFFVRL